MNIFRSESDLTPIRDRIRTWHNSAFDASYRMGQYTKFIDRIAKSKTTISTSTTQTAIDRNTYIDRLLALIPSLYNTPIYVLDPAGNRTMNGFIQIVDETNEVVGWLSKNGVSVPPELTQIVDQLYKLIKTYQLYQVAGFVAGVTTGTVAANDYLQVINGGTSMIDEGSNGGTQPTADALAVTVTVNTATNADVYMFGNPVKCAIS